MALPPKLSFSEVLPDLRTWNQDKGVDSESPEDWLSLYGSIPQAILYSAIFWPTFVEYQGCLLWKDFRPESFEDWMGSTGGNKTAVESVMNHRHITDFFLNAEEQPTPEQIAYLGHVLRDIWYLKLTHDFPHLDIQVEFYWKDVEFDEDAQLFVYCCR